MENAASVEETTAGQVTGPVPMTRRAGGRWQKYDAAEPGLQEYWYPAAMAKDVRRKKKLACTIAGNKVLLTYTAGKYYAIHNVCPHRLIPLSLGSLEFPGHVSCVYHGWVFNLETGRLAAALSDGPDSPVAGKVCVRTFPVEERVGVLWLWTGKGDPVPVEDDIPEEILRNDAVIFPLMRDVKGNWRYASENGFDEAHVKVLHRTSWWTFFRGIAAWNSTRITTSDDGLWLNRYQEEVHIDDDYPGIGRWPKAKFWQRRKRPRTIFGQKDHAVSIRLPCMLRVHQPGNANWTHYDFYVPTDSENYRYLALAVSWRKNPLSIVWWWFRFWSYILVVHHYWFNGQDLQMVGLMPESSPSRAFRPDVSLFAWRRLVEEYAAEPSRPRKKLPPNVDFMAMPTPDVPTRGAA
jgi:phenylpropionate dioxygenase-like ring-hydroxylating dioxygenase large terminal subunit